ncbi:MAG: Rieske (2Fe-2S) protein [Bacteroidota bacterium]
MFKRVYYTERIKIFESLLDAKAQLKENYVQKFTVKNKTICLLLNNNVLYAFENKCPHNGASLVGAKCAENKSIVCPLHRYAFSLIDGKAVSNPCGPLQLYKVVVDENGVFIEFEKSRFKFF